MHRIRVQVICISSYEHDITVKKTNWVFIVLGTLAKLQKLKKLIACFVHLRGSNLIKIVNGFETLPTALTLATLDTDKGKKACPTSARKIYCQCCHPASLRVSVGRNDNQNYCIIFSSPETIKFQMVYVASESRSDMKITIESEFMNIFMLYYFSNLSQALWHHQRKPPLENCKIWTIRLSILILHLFSYCSFL